MRQTPISKNTTRQFVFTGDQNRICEINELLKYLTNSELVNFALREFAVPSYTKYIVGTYDSRRLPKRVPQAKIEGSKINYEIRLPQDCIDEINHWHKNYQLKDIINKGLDMILAQCKDDYGKIDIRRKFEFNGVMVDLTNGWS